MNIRSLRLAALLSLAPAPLFAGISPGNNITVACPPSSGGDFSSVNAALAALGPVLGARITISGTCSEAVSIFQAQNLTLQGTGGAAIVDPGPSGRNGQIAVLGIYQSKNVQVFSLKLHGEGLNATHIVGSDVSFQDCTLEGGGLLAGGGAFVQGHSEVRMRAVLIQDNQPSGIRLDPGSVLSIGEPSADDALHPSIVQRNPLGINVRSGAQAQIHGATVIRDNSTGVLGTGGGVVFCCGDAQREVRNNFVGVNLTAGSTLEMNGPALIADNSGAGLRLNGSSGVLRGQQSFRRNGQQGARAAGGIVILGNSHLEINGATISGNYGSGVAVRDDSSARLFANVIEGNGGDGVRAMNLSSAGLLGANQIDGNHFFDLFCTPDSLAYGDFTGVGHSRCRGQSDAEDGDRDRDDR